MLQCCKAYFYCVCLVCRIAERLQIIDVLIIDVVDLTEPN